MNWTQLLSGKRFGMEEYHERKHERTDFQRDYDRLIFSSPFRMDRITHGSLRRKRIPPDRASIHDTGIPPAGKYLCA